MTNAASAETACGLCRARRRKTNEVQSNICIVSIQILRRSSDLLRMTKREELRSAQRVGTKLFIVRKLRGRLEYATGGNEGWKMGMAVRIVRECASFRCKPNS